MTTSDATSSPATSSRMKRLRRRSVIGKSEAAYWPVSRANPPERSLVRGQDEEQPSVVIVGRKQIRRRASGQVVLRVDLHRLGQLAHAPLEHRAHGVVAAGEAQAEHLGDRTADDLLVVKAGQLEGAAPAGDDLALLVAGEERRVRRGVVVVEELEQEAEPALGAPARLTPEPGVALGGGGAVAAVGAEEEGANRCANRVARRSRGFSRSLWYTLAHAERRAGARR